MSTDSVDVAQLQADPSHSGATFQVASNFNGVEGISEEIYPNSPDFATHYIYDFTQGPSASISAGPSAIARIYAAFYDPGIDPQLWPQTERRQVRMLEAFPYVSVLNGYAVIDDLAYQEMNESIDAHVGQVFVGVQRNTQVTYSKRADGFFSCAPRSAKVHQVFCAALNLKQGAAGAMTKAHPNALKVATVLLRAAYQCTYLSAIANQSQELFLTMLGCGAFGNDQETVFDEIVHVHKLYATNQGFNRGNLSKVYLVMFRKTSVIETFVEKLKMEGIPYKVLVNKIQVPM